MKYSKIIILKNGISCLLRNTTSADAEAVIKNYYKVHNETDFLLSYSDEKSFDISEEAKMIAEREESEKEVTLASIVDGRLIGLAGVYSIGIKDKIKHRAVVGLSVEKEYWGLGIGRALMEGCIYCAKKAGYKQIELEVVADNINAVELYKKLGFKEYGRNPKAYCSRYTGWQEVIFMFLDLEKLD